jgi:transcriptional repressor NrdR
MKCPACDVDNDRVIDSRASQDGFTIRRRRECLNCHHRFTTYERVEQPPVRVVKKDGCREPFDREKIRQGLEKACWKRPISEEQIESVLVRVENEIAARGETELESRDIGELVMGQLKDLDQVAFVRFASVYREFTDAQDFMNELRPMLAQTKKDSH